MTSQIPLLVETLDDALRATVIALGGNKTVGAKLWPSKDPEDAGRQLANALNHKKRDVLEPHELALIRREARKANVHTLAAWEMRDAGYADPQPIEPEDERAALQRAFVEQSKQMQVLFAKMQRAGLTPTS